jgi:tryptophanyl-tRNA synthetase
MSKSYHNTIPLFAESGELRKAVMRIVTDSKAPDDPKDPDSCNIFNIYRHFAPAEDVAAVRARYLNGGLAYGAMKHTLFALLDATLADARSRYQTLLADRDYLDQVLAQGALKAREMAAPVMARVRESVGMG